MQLQRYLSAYKTLLPSSSSFHASLSPLDKVVYLDPHTASSRTTVILFVVFLFRFLKVSNVLFVYSVCHLTRLVSSLFQLFSLTSFTLLTFRILRFFSFFYFFIQLGTSLGKGWRIALLIWAVRCMSRWCGQQYALAARYCPRIWSTR